MPGYPFEPVPEPEIISRIRNLKMQMAEQGLGALFLTHRPDIYYFCGTAQDCYLYVETDRDPVLFVKRYLPRAR
nr:aminopeptidase P family protein [Desulfobacula sp.]